MTSEEESLYAARWADNILEKYQVDLLRGFAQPLKYYIQDGIRRIISDTGTNEKQQIETTIRAKGKTAPRIRPQDLDDAIDPNVRGQYHVFPGSNTTVCLLTLKNGFTVTGESACVDPANFDEEIGREVAFKDARNKLWPLLGFALKERFAAEASLMVNPSEA